MIEVQGIRKSFDGLQVLKGIDLRVDAGEIVSIVGPSGAGKTTLLQIMGTLDRPDSGRVSFDGEEPLRMNDSQLARFRNRNVGFVFQFHQLLPEFTLLENVAMPALIGGRKRPEAFAAARRLIDYLGLTAAVARALVNEPKAVLADEPSGSLDSRNRAELHRLFFDLRRDFGQTFVIVTHDEHLAADTDRRVMMADGMITSIETK